MNTWIRWAKFNLVGGIGMVVQLGALAMLSRCMPRHYLCASALAIELTLLHNFAWHQRFTWRDRPAAWPGQLLRFHLSNGLVSMAGNLILMRLLVDGAHLPVVASNLVAIVCCSVANFAMSNVWAFRSVAPSVP